MHSRTRRVFTPCWRRCLHLEVLQPMRNPSLSMTTIVLNTWYLHPLKKCEDIAHVCVCVCVSLPYVMSLFHPNLNSCCFTWLQVPGYGRYILTYFILDLGSPILTASAASLKHESKSNEMLRHFASHPKGNQELSAHTSVCVNCGASCPTLHKRVRPRIGPRRAVHR